MQALIMNDCVDLTTSLRYQRNKIILLKHQSLFMKYGIIPLLLISIYTSAQECKLNKVTDPFTKETKLSTGFIGLQNASITVDADKTEIDFFFSLNGNDKCFDNNSMAAVFFEGSKAKISYRNSGSMNCEGFFHFNFKNTEGTPSLLQKLSTQKIASILFIGNDKKETRIIFTTEQ